MTKEEPRTIYGKPYRGRYIDILMWHNGRYGWQYSDHDFITASTGTFVSQEEALQAAEDEIDEEIARCL